MTDANNTQAAREEEPENSALAAARDYTRRGWRVVPVRPGGKDVAIVRWQEMRLDEDELPKWFGAIGGSGARRGGLRHNIGVLLGEPSGGLVDVDCDAREATLAAAELLPATGLVSGRAGNPASHYWYRIEGTLPATAKFADVGAALSPSPSPKGGGEPEADASPAGRMVAQALPSQGRVAEGRERSAHHTTMLVELRSTGQQTVVPPSLHPSGETLRWERGSGGIGGITQGEPGVVSARDLRTAVARVAAVALLARHWPGEGQRDEAAKDLAGLLLRGGWSETEVDDFTRLVARIAGDEEWRRRGKARHTAQKLTEGGPVTGGTSLAGRLGGDGARVVAQARAWLHLPGAVSLGSAYIAEGGQLSDMAVFAGGGVVVETSPVGNVGQMLDDVAPTLVRPLWGGRLYLGKLAICDGDPGHGKTLLALDLAARVTTGREMPDGSPGLTCGPVGVAYFTSEDDPADTIRPRLDAAGGDASRLVVVTTVPMLASDGTLVERQPTFRDLDVITRAIRRVGARLVIFDPFMAYLDSQTNSFRDQDVRGVLAPLARLAERTDAAFLFIRHLNKGGGGHALYRGGGSIGIVAAARSGLLVGRDPDDPERRVVASTKNNLGMSPVSLAYRVVESPRGAPIIQWEGESPYDARALLQAEETSANESEVGRASVFLRELLADGPQPERLIQERARAMGISERTLRRGKMRLKIKSAKAGYGSGWTWTISDDEETIGQTKEARHAPKTANAPEDGHARGLARFVDVGSLRTLTSAQELCQASGGPHDYDGAYRDADGRLRCVKCWTPYPDEDEPGSSEQDGQGAQP